MLLVVLVGAGLWRFAGTKEGKVIFGAIGEATRIVAEAQSAPGAAEVRALGCEQAMVLDTERMAKLFEQLDASAGHSDDFGVMVMCQVGALGTPPTCDQVAHAYHAAVGTPPRPYAANVRHQGRAGEICSTLYDTSGKKVRDLPTGSAPHVSGGR